MKNILLPTDFSENSINAIDYAMLFFRTKAVNFYLLNVQKSSEYITDDLIAGTKSETVYDKIAKDNKQELADLKEKLITAFGSEAYNFYEIFDFDDLISGIEQAVQRYDIHLIVMGTNGATGAEEVIFGSNTLKVIRSLDYPTLTIPETYKFSGIKSSIFSTELHNSFSYERIGILREILDMHHNQLSVVEVFEDNINLSEKANNDEIQNLFPKQNYQYFNINSVAGLAAANIASQILEVDFHATYIENEHFIDRLIYGSKNSMMLYRTSIPLLFIHHGE